MRMRLIERVRPRTTIFSAVAILALSGLLISGLLALHTNHAYQIARQGQMATEAGLLIHRANYYYAMERGFTAAQLELTAGASSPQLEALPEFRAKADEMLLKARSVAQSLLANGDPYPLLIHTLERWEMAHAEFQQARTLASQPSPAGAPALTPARWLETSTLHIQRAAQLRNSLSAFITSVPVTLRSYWVLDNWLGEIGEHAGRERALLAVLIASGKPLDVVTGTRLASYRRVVDAHLSHLTELLKDEAIDSRVREMLLEITTQFAGPFEGVRMDVYSAAQSGRYPISASAWLNLSTAAINSLVNASRIIGTIIQAELAAEIHQHQLQFVLAISAIAIAIVMALLAFAATASGARRLESARDAAESHLREVEREASARRRAESALRALVEKNPVGTLVMDSERHTLFANPAALEMLGADFEQLQTHPPKLPLLIGARTERAIQRAGRRGGIAELTVTDTEWDECDARLIMLRDVTDTKMAELALQHVSRHDPLTGLPNHTLFMDRLEQALIRARRFTLSLRVLIIDLDRFRFINETLGHAIGDRLLRTGGERIRAAVRETDTVARIGSDQFAVLLENLADDESAELVLTKITKAFNTTHDTLGEAVRCTASIGISAFPHDARDAETLVRYADIALQTAKQSGGNTARPFSAELHAKAASRPQLEQALTEAIARDEMSLHYQPRIDLHNGKIVGMEALLRWQHPELGFVSPAEFIPIAEDSGLIITIGEWVLHTACTQTQAWHQAGMPAVTVSVNLSALQLAQYDIADTVAQVLGDTHLPPHCLELEITESAIIHNADSAADKISRLRELGVRCSIDDFGTGYSSLSYLRQLPIHALKVDRSFVHKVSQDPSNAAITNAIISMARDLGLRVVAEGVETEEDAAYLRQRECDEVQGYYFARPLPAPDFAAYLVHPPTFGLIEMASDQAHRTLLILDDDNNVLNALVRLLRNEGYNILTACEPEQAFKLLARHRTGLIISDLRMPKMSGIEFLKRCRQLHPQAARIILSGADDRDAVMTSINEVGVYKYLAKPWDDSVLRNVVREALGKSVKVRNGVAATN